MNQSCGHLAFSEEDVKMNDIKKRQKLSTQKPIKLDEKRYLIKVERADTFRCAMHGIPCEYGICDECIITTGNYKF